MNVCEDVCIYIFKMCVYIYSRVFTLLRLTHNYMQHMLRYSSAKLHISSLTVGFQYEVCTCMSVPVYEYKFVYIYDKFAALLRYHT